MIQFYCLLKVVLVAICLMVFPSCKSYKDVSYFQNIDEISLSYLNDTIVNYQVRIMPDDLLGITVTGLDPNTVAPFNLPAMSFLMPGEKEVSFVQNLQSYLVSQEGDINFPVLGKVKVAGLTKQEGIDYLQALISNYVKNPIVNIQFLNFKISVLGEVGRPGFYVMSNDRTSILDAIGYAGDLTIYGERNNVLLIRDNNGTKEFHRFDLSRSDLFASPYYYLQQNDIIYVEPNRSKQRNSRYSQQDSFNVSLLSAIVSTLSVITSLVIALLVK
ncbi:MAG: polysaccharide biosynthesis/export family protein [Bacteroidales bacterium]